MNHDIWFEANCDRIKNNKEKNITNYNKRENLNRIKHKYNIGNRITLRKAGLRQKLWAPKEGPYSILHVGTNGKVKIQRSIVHGRVNINRIEPLFEH
jgi:hypothetical protein